MTTLAERLTDYAMSLRYRDLPAGVGPLPLRRWPTKPSAASATVATSNLNLTT